MISTPNSPRVALLRAKLALVMGDSDIHPAYHEIKATRSNAFDEPWSNDMSGPIKHVVLNKTFAMSGVDSADLAWRISHAQPIDCGENIKLCCKANSVPAIISTEMEFSYQLGLVNDVIMRDIMRYMGTDLSHDPAWTQFPTVSPNFFWMIGWVNKITGKTKEGETKASKEKNLGNDNKGDEDGVAKAREGLGKESLVEADEDDTQKSRREEGGTAASANDNTTKENAVLKTGEKLGKDGTTRATERER